MVRFFFFTFNQEIVNQWIQYALINWEEKLTQEEMLSDETKIDWTQRYIGINDHLLLFVVI